jgi:hypothetical protein
MSQTRHPGITMHKLSFGGGFVGLLFAAGSAIIFIVGFPTLWYFVAFAFALGVLIAGMLRLIARRTSDRNQPPSILHAPSAREALVFPKRAKIPPQFHIETQPASV